MKSNHVREGITDRPVPLVRQSVIDPRELQNVWMISSQPGFAGNPDLQNGWKRLSYLTGQKCPITPKVKYKMCPVRTTDHVRSNKDSAVQDRDKAVVEAATAAASSLLIAKNKEAWKAIAEACGSDDTTPNPFGDPRFRAVWENTFAKRPNTERLDDTMERCILACRGQRIPIPKTFYDAKRCVENSESRYALNVEPDEAVRVAGPRGVGPEFAHLVKPEPDEVARVAGPRGVREELMR